MVDYVLSLKLEKLTVVSPDAGGVERARAFAKRLQAELAIMDKRRDADNVAKIMHIIGDVEGRNVVIVDDIIDTGGTVKETVDALHKAGVGRIFACMTHGILSGPAIDRLTGSKLENILLTNTIPLDEEKRERLKPEILSVAGLLGEAIKRIHTNSSVSSLFV